MHIHHHYYIYLLTNKNNTVLYTGVTSDLKSRIWQHKTKHYPKSFSAKYNLEKLVYYEVFRDINQAIFREKQIKSGSRARKVKLIESMNPEWLDLYEDLD